MLPRAGKSAWGVAWREAGRGASGAAWSSACAGISTEAPAATVLAATELQIDVQGSG